MVFPEGNKLPHTLKNPQRDGVAFPDGMYCDACARECEDCNGKGYYHEAGLYRTVKPEWSYGVKCMACSGTGSVKI
jgi:DnaJ-class molecular chaperone